MATWFWLEVFCEVAVTCWPELRSSEGLNVTEASTSEVVSWQVDAGYWHQLLSTWPSRESCWCVLTRWWLDSPRESDPKENKPGRSYSFCDLFWEVTYHHSGHILFVRSELVSLAHKKRKIKSHFFFFFLGKGCQSILKQSQWGKHLPEEMRKRKRKKPSKNKAPGNRRKAVLKEDIKINIIENRWAIICNVYVCLFVF